MSEDLPSDGDVNDRASALQEELDRLRALSPEQAEAELAKIDPLARALCTIETMRRDASAQSAEFARVAVRYMTESADAGCRAALAEFKLSQIKESCVAVAEMGGTPAEIVARIRALT